MENTQAAIHEFCGRKKCLVNPEAAEATTACPKEKYGHWRHQAEGIWLCNSEAIIHYDVKQIFKDQLCVMGAQQIDTAD